MIGFLKGHVLEIADEFLYLDVGGVGYELACSTETLETVTSLTTEAVRLWVFTHVREDAIALFGFASATEKKMFQSLLKVNGVGPKMALKILSAAPVTALLEIIDRGDVKALSALPKVGKKTAEQLILTLKGKLTFADTDAARPSKGTAAVHGDVRAEILSALVNLGFRAADAEPIVDSLSEPDQSLGFEEGLRRALRALSGKPGAKPSGARRPPEAST